MAQHHHAVSPLRPDSVRRGYEELDHAVRIIRQVCQQSRSANLIAETRASLRAEGIGSAIRQHNSAALFDWLITMLSYRGISDRVAADYLERHGQATWQAIEHDLQHGPSCPKLKSYWHFHDCRYSKQHYTCAEPEHLPQCPLPKYWLRNGGLNQTAFSLFYLFIRDVADGDLVRWLDRRLQAARKPAGPDQLAVMRMAVLAPLKERGLRLTARQALLGSAAGPCSRRHKTTAAIVEQRVLPAWRRATAPHPRVRFRAFPRRRP